MIIGLLIGIALTVFLVAWTFQGDIYDRYMRWALTDQQYRRYRLAKAAKRAVIWSDHQLKVEEIKLGIISDPSRHNHESDISCNAGLCAAYESPKGMVTPRPGLTKEQLHALHYQHPKLGCTCKGCVRNHDEYMEATVASYKEARERYPFPHPVEPWENPFGEDAYRKSQPGYRRPETPGRG